MSRMLVLVLALLGMVACVSAPDRGEVSPAHRAVPTPSSGHETDVPTTSRTAAQRPPDREVDAGSIRWSGDDVDAGPPAVRSPVPID